MNPLAHKFTKKRKDHPRGRGFADMTPERRALMMALRKLPWPKRFWRQVDKSGGCWIWTGSILKDGYGQMWFKGRMRRAHHVSLELSGIEPTKDGNVVDHLCRNRACVRPDHLRVVPMRVNSRENNLSPWQANRERTHCSKCGNPLSGANLALVPRTKNYTRHGNLRPGVVTVGRYCLTCYPHNWRHAAIPRSRPPGSKYLPSDPDYDQRPRKQSARNSFQSRQDDN